VAAGSTYSSIATTTLSGTATTVTFSSIASTYTDLVLIVSAQSDSGYIALRLNGDSTANYSRTGLSGDGTSATSFRASGAGETRLPFFGAATLPTSGSSYFIATLNFMNYSNTTTYKTVLTRDNAAATGTDAQYGFWLSSSAFTHIVLYRHYNIGSGNFLTGSTFTLYGILSA